MSQLTARDLEQLQAKGITVADIEQQLENFQKGFPPANLVKPATVNDGINKLEKTEVDELIEFFSSHIDDRNMLKFVPASGAASRMFKFLYEYLTYPNNKKKEIIQFTEGLDNFAFYVDLKNVIERQGIDLSEALNQKRYNLIINALVSSKGLNYGSLPKALIKFHKYDYHTRTALEEHLVEGVQYATNKEKSANLHFTISPEHEQLFLSLLENIQESYQKYYNTNFIIDYSFQKESTDMVAVDLENRFIRNPEGRLLFRPGGHGALLENLNQIDTDIIFIKNIDNVVPDRLKETTTIYKKALAGLLLKLQKSIFQYLELLEGPDDLSENQISEIIHFTENQLSLRFPENFNTMDRLQVVNYLKTILNRPVRVCGMVKNEGQPGGGPFWVKENDGRLSLQIVEKAQIETNNKNQREILENSTHFNPVDLVCGVKDYKGRKFDLLQFRDPNTGLISKKSKDGQELKAQELPGLWNGGMAFWNTIFVEVPLITFNPVKTVNDLLRDEHQ
ncbi:MAG: DUF4301 family protein [Bacteroidales bacterium]